MDIDTPTGAPASIVCFKNGFSFISVPVTLQDTSNDGRVKESTVGPLPSFAVHGTVGLQPGDESKTKILSLSQIDRAKEELKLEAPSLQSATFHNVLQANVGACVRLEFSNYKNQTSVVGKVKFVQPGDTGLAVLERNKTEEWLQTGAITRITVMSPAEVDQSRNSNDDTYLLARYASDGDSALATLSYLTRGLTWAPSYTIIMDQENKTINLHGKACLLCDIPFLDGEVIKELSLVAGQPHMEFQNVNDPLVSGDSAESFIRSLRQVGSPGRLRCLPTPGVTMQNSVCMGSGLFGSSPAAPSQDPEGVKGGESVQDFFHYVLENVPLKKNRPISIPFIEIKNSTNYEDIYTVNFSQDCSEDGFAEVKHAIAFQNRTGKPFTTAPATILAMTKGAISNKFLVQGVMNYTGIGMDANIAMTNAMDVQAQIVVETKEVKRESLEEDNINNENTYVNVTFKQVKVVIMNDKGDNIKCKGEYDLYGQMIDSKPMFKEKVEQRPNHWQTRDLNLRTKYVWEVEVGSKSKTEIIFNFCVKDRHVKRRGFCG